MNRAIPPPLVETDRPLVLIVDDSPAQRRMLAVQLGRAGFRVINAANGAEAVALFAQKRPDIVVSDWVMPGMSGPDLCRALRAAQGDDYLYFILLTSRAEKNAVAYGLEAGADDFMAKPVASAELLARMRAGARIVRLQAQQRDSRARLQLALDELRLAQSAIERDLAEARQLQHALTGERQRRFGDFSVSSLLQSAGQIGGDLVGMFPVNPRCFGFYAIDVSGHGVVAALLTARLAAQLSPSLDQNAALRMNEWGLYDARAPVELAEYLNHLMLADFRIDSYFTLVYGLADAVTGEVRLVQAGHPHPVILRRDGSTEKVGRGGMPVGLIENASYEETRLTLAPGDRLLVVSDGISEATDPAGVELGNRGLRNLMSEAAPLRGAGFLERLCRRVIERSGNRQDDDISALFLERGEG